MTEETTMRPTILFIFTFLFAFSCPSHAQPDSLWSRTYGGGDEDWCYSVIQTVDGGFALAGTTRSFPAGRNSVILIKTDNEGDSLWSQTFDCGAGDIRCYSLVQTFDGGYTLAGAVDVFGWRDYHFWMARTDENGEILWNRVYGDEMEYGAFISILQTPDSGFAIAGYMNDFMLLRTNADGDSLWSRTYGGENNDRCYCMTQTTDGGFALAGFSDSFGLDGNFWLVVTNSDGDSLWSQSYGVRNERQDVCQAILQTEDGGFILAGDTGEEGVEVLVIRTDADGDSIWSRQFEGEQGRKCKSIIRVQGGGFTLGGVAYVHGHGWDFWLTRLAANGDSLWSFTAGTESTEWCYTAISTADGGFALAGKIDSLGAGANDFWLVKTGPDPCSAPSGPFIHNPSSFILYPAFPNPFNSAATIKYGLPCPGHVTLRIYNPLGQQVGTLFEGYQHPGFHTATLNGGDLASGLYFVRLEAGSRDQITNVLLIR